MKVGFITGFSNWGNNSLSPIQFEFMKNINIKESNKIYLNFPYINNNQLYKDPNIVSASISNAAQYMLSKTSWLKNKEQHFKSIIKEENKILLLSGSCGLEIIRNMNLLKEEKEKIHIIAYGGVAKEIPDFKYLTLVQSKNDWISRIWIKDYDLMIEGNHMNYLQSSQLLNFINEYVGKMESSL